jgi:hypothetical protein
MDCLISSGLLWKHANPHLNNLKKEPVMCRSAILLTSCLFLMLGLASGESKDKELKIYLDGVTERGRALYAYDQAAWHATDAFFELKPDTKDLTHYICTKTSSGWLVTFPKWNETRDKLLVAYEAMETEPGKYEARKVDPPTEASSDQTAKELALELALADFQRPQRPYNSAILPAPNGNFYVYLYPGQTKDTVWPIGGDVRYTISPDGKQIVEKRQLHKTILDIEIKPDVHPEGGYHVHVLSDVPEDTDVLYVLTRKPSIPEYVGTQKRIFVVNTDGTIAVTKR